MYGFPHSIKKGGPHPGILCEEFFTLLSSFLCRHVNEILRLLISMGGGGGGGSNSIVGAPLPITKLDVGAPLTPWGLPRT